MKLTYKLDGFRKLQLAGFEWLEFDDESQIEEKLDELAQRMKKAINTSEERKASKSQRQKDGKHDVTLPHFNHSRVYLYAGP